MAEPSIIYLESTLDGVLGEMNLIGESYSTPEVAATMLGTLLDSHQAHWLHHRAVTTNLTNAHGAGYPAQGGGEGIGRWQQYYSCSILPEGGGLSPGTYEVLQCILA